jgi:nitrite reductase/ring-hydroxylating ferredoxin subunit
MGLRARIKSGLLRLVGGGPPVSERSSHDVAPSQVEPGWAAPLRAAAIVEGRPQQIRAHGRAWAAFRVGADVFVTDNACLHEDGPLGEGAQTGCIVVCPYHDWRFDVTSGACLSAPGRRLAVCPTRVVDGWLWVGPVVPGTEERGGDHDDGLATR